MSSHHIVRDEQEPALILVSPNINHNLLGNLLEWSPTVIADAGILDHLLLTNFKLDVVIGEEDQLTNIKPKLNHQEPIKYLSKNKGENSLIQALYFLRASDYSAVNISINMSTQLSGELIPFLNQLDIVIYDGNVKWVYSKEGSFSKWLAKGQELHFLDQVDVYFNNEFLESQKSTHKTDSDGFHQFKSKSAGFWLGEAI